VLIEKYVPDFVIDMEKGEVATRSQIPNNPALVAKVTTGAEAGRAFYLFGRRELRDNGHGNSLGIEYQYTAGEAAWVDNPDGPINPAAEVEIRHSSGRVDTALLMAAQPQPINLGGDRLLVYREKPEMIKNYRSTLTVVKDGRDVMTQEIKVNHPMFYEGFGFYQANFDPRNPNYSGIEVVKDPGLPIVTFGLWALIAGVFQTVALRNWKPWWERRGVSATHQGVEAAA
jgi:cytochrome c biogenesis protein ResB